jgi:hypothetical protein
VSHQQEATMSGERPDHHDAELVMKVYDLRREPVMRESRALIQSKFWPKSAGEVLAVTGSDHPLNAAFRQVNTYWEMVYGMVKWGIVHAGYFLESNAEGLFLFAKIAPHLEAYRKDYSATGFRNAEWVATQCPPGRTLYETVSARVRKVLETK